MPSYGIDKLEKRWLVKRNKAVAVKGVGSVLEVLLAGRYDEVIAMVDAKLRKGFWDCRNALHVIKALAQICQGKQEEGMETLHAIEILYSRKNIIAGDRWFGVAPQLRGVLPRGFLHLLDSAILEAADAPEPFDPSLDTSTPASWRYDASVPPPFITDAERKSAVAKAERRALAQVMEERRREKLLHAAPRAEALQHLNVHKLVRRPAEPKHAGEKRTASKSPRAASVARPRAIKASKTMPPQAAASRMLNAVSPTSPPPASRKTATAPAPRYNGETGEQVAGKAKAAAMTPTMEDTKPAFDLPPFDMPSVDGGLATPPLQVQAPVTTASAMSSPGTDYNGDDEDDDAGSMAAVHRIIGGRGVATRKFRRSDSDSAKTTFSLDQPAATPLAARRATASQGRFNSHRSEAGGLPRRAMFTAVVGTTFRRRPVALKQSNLSTSVSGVSEPIPWVDELEEVDANPVAYEVAHV